MNQLLGDLHKERLERQQQRAATVDTATRLPTVAGTLSIVEAPGLGLRSTLTPATTALAEYIANELFSNNSAPKSQVGQPSYASAFVSPTLLKESDYILVLNAGCGAVSVALALTSKAHICIVDDAAYRSLLAATFAANNLSLDDERFQFLTHAEHAALQTSSPSTCYEMLFVSDVESVYGDDANDSRSRLLLSTLTAATNIGTNVFVSAHDRTDYGRPARLQLMPRQESRKITQLEHFLSLSSRLFEVECVIKECVWRFQRRPGAFLLNQLE